MRHVSAQPEDQLYRLLSALQRKEFLYEQSAFPEVEYFFKHALTHEVAYTSVLIERRKALHEQTAQAIERLFHDRLEEHYSELAHHYSSSGSTEKAVTYLLRDLRSVWVNKPRAVDSVAQPADSWKTNCSAASISSVPVLWPSPLSCL